MSAYRKEELILLLPGIWDHDVAIHGRDLTEDEAEARELMEGMPRSASNPAELNTHLAKIADVQRAWVLTELTQRQRQCIVLVFGLGFEHEDAGAKLGVTRRAVGYSIERGVERILCFLNGKPTSDLEEDE